jgi:hypothetical protein
VLRGLRSPAGLIRLGLALGAVAGVLAALAPLGDLVEGPARAGGGTNVLQIDGPAVASLALVAAALLAGAAAAPWLWAWLAGVAVTVALAAGAGLIVVSARTSDDFAKDADVSLKGGGVLLTLAFWLGIVAVVVALVGFRRFALAPTETRPRYEGPLRTTAKATTSLVLGIAGFVTVLAAPLAVAFAALALGEIRAADGRLRGRGLALSGLVLGIVALSLLTALVGLGTLAAKPS